MQDFTQIVLIISEFFVTCEILLLLRWFYLALHPSETHLSLKVHASLLEQETLKLEIVRSLIRRIETNLNFCKILLLLVSALPYFCSEVFLGLVH